MKTASRPALLSGLLAVLVCAGCVEPADPADPTGRAAVGPDAEITANSLQLPPSLAGTRWRLIAYQSMDDTSEQPPDSIRYTLDLGADGLVAMQLNCNRGTGTWSAEMGPGVESATETEAGTLAFGPMAVTRALCPPPSMDEQLARDMERVRGYQLRGDTLSLSLMADGGLYFWEVAADGDS